MAISLPQVVSRFIGKHGFKGIGLPIVTDARIGVSSIQGRMIFQGKPYTYEISDKGLEYGPAGLRKDARDRNKCSGKTSYQCGRTCISKDKRCRIKDQGVKQEAGTLVQVARQLSGLEKGLIKAFGYTPIDSIPARSGPEISSTELQKVVEGTEDSVKDNDKFETLFFIDPKTGQKLLELPGGKTAVNPFFEADTIAEIRKRRPVVTHNHPWLESDGIDSMGVSLSGPDISTAAFLNTSQVRAVSAGYRHVMTSPPGGWNKRYQSTEGVMEIRQMYEENQTRVAIGLAEDFQKGKITMAEVSEQLSHRTTALTARQLGATYTRTPIKEVNKGDVIAKRIKAKRDAEAKERRKQLILAVAGLAGYALLASIQTENTGAAASRVPEVK